ncbi:hypothetical protein N7510_010046 [Penicillium lagena]|uniref:uncharacterized protein n=1 Tax=Penicillium lagena TaxID=94218 RepID=UPI0025423ABC|nr:uncharacterized protein N7510_010046 [Penicillium lagena]KAJ5604892.1 hypothetical protein N7510_010046 [Penicillium lagena]
MDSTSLSIPPSDSSFAAAASPYFDSLFRRRQQKKMSITETYYLAHTARKKLTREASRADHDLRLLVGHANLLDSLMVDLADAENEQERWFNQTVHGAAKAQDDQPPKHIQWATATTIVEEPEEDWGHEDVSDLDSDFSDEDEDEVDDDDYDERDFVIAALPPRRRAPSPVAVIHEQELMEDEDDDDDDDDTDSDFEYDDVEDLEKLCLTRSPSRASQSPPELLADLDDDSEDDNLPPSPPQPTIEVFDEKAAAAAVQATSMSSLKDNHLFEEQEYYVSPPHQEQTLIEAY